MIRIDTPKNNDLVSDKFVLAGFAGGAFEASYNWRVSDGHYEISGHFMAGDGTGGRGQFHTIADVSEHSRDFKQARVFLDVWHESAKDGSELERVQKIILIGNAIVDDYHSYFPHRVKEGETLWKIAIQHYGRGQDYQKIIQANNRIDDYIVPGEVLRIPR